MWDMSIYGEDVLIAGNFSGPSSKNNLVQVKGETEAGGSGGMRPSAEVGSGGALI